MNNFGGYKPVVLATTVALALATWLGGCGFSDTGPVGQATAQVVSQAPIAPVNDIALTQGTGPANEILWSGGGPATRIWLMDSKYHKIVAAINADGTDGRNIPVMTTAHQYTYPELHDNHSAVTNSDFSRIYGTVWGSYDEPSYLVEYDPKTLRETRRAPAGKGAHHSAISQDDKYMYVANQYETFLSIIDVTTMTKLKDIELGAMVVYPSKSSYFYTTDANGKSTRIPIPTKYCFVTVTGPKPISNSQAAPTGVAATNAVAVIDMTTNTLVKMIPIGQSIHSVNVTLDGKEAWVSGASLTVIDTATLTITRTVPYASTHQNFSPDNKYVYATSSTGLIKIDRATYTAVWRASDGGSAHVQVSNDGTEVYTQGVNTLRYPYLLGARAVAGIQVFSAADGKLITEIPFNNGTHEMDIMPKSAVGLPAPAASPVGATLFTSNCQVCHGAGGQGGSASDDLNKGNYFGKADKVLAYIVAGNPGLGMPSFATKLTTAQLQAISDYVAGLK